MIGHCDITRIHDTPKAMIARGAFGHRQWVAQAYTQQGDHVDVQTLGNEVLSEEETMYVQALVMDIYERDSEDIGVYQFDKGQWFKLGQYCYSEAMKIKRGYPDGTIFFLPRGWTPEDTFHA